MINRNYFLCAILILLLTGCIPAMNRFTLHPDETADPAMRPTDISALMNPTTNLQVEFSVETLANSIFYLPYFQKEVQLLDGKHTFTDNGGMSFVELLSPIALGDVNHDQIQDAVVLLAENSGEKGVFVSLVVLIGRENGYVQIGNALIDDRPILHSLTINEDEIVLEATIHSFSDLLLEPTLRVVERYEVLDERLTLMSFTSQLPGGQVREIFIDSLLNGDELTNPIQLTGSMPVGPFENNLRLAVYDLSGNLLFETGFMVEALDMGAPVTFDQQVHLDNVEPDTMIRVELSDLSMADGSLFALDSVIIKIH